MLHDGDMGRSLSIPGMVLLEIYLEFTQDPEGDPQPA